MKTFGFAALNPLSWAKNKMKPCADQARTLSRPFFQLSLQKYE